MSRVSEKSLELTVCAEVGRTTAKPILFVGLTQLEERARGYDFAFDLGAVTFLIQMKRMSRRLRTGEPQFQLDHRQLATLQATAPGPGTTYYALPSVYKNADLERETLAGTLLDVVWLMDVAQVQPRPFPPPTFTDSNQIRRPRKSDNHYARINEAAATVTLYSDPVDVPVTRMSAWATALRAGAWSRHTSTEHPVPHGFHRAEDLHRAVAKLPSVRGVYLLSLRP